MFIVRLLQEVSGELWLVESPILLLPENLFSKRVYRRQVPPPFLVKLAQQTRQGPLGHIYPVRRALTLVWRLLARVLDRFEGVQLAEAQFSVVTLLELFLQSKVDFRSAHFLKLFELGLSPLKQGQLGLLFFWFPLGQSPTQL